MLTLSQIDIYSKYNGDGDNFNRCSTSEEKIIITYKDWSLITSFMQDICLVLKGLASESYSNMVNDRLSENCDNNETIHKLKCVAEERFISDR